MSTLSSTAVQDTSEWEIDIRRCEEKACAAFLAADVQALENLWADGYAVNSPLQQVLPKARVLELLQAGRIRHLSYEFEIEYLHRHGDAVVVMGRDRVTDPPDGTVSERRFTNVWQLDGGVWRSIARHAHVVSRQAAG
ncbi:MAG: nuclear transport factor 2 family protein [Acidobacteriota bacterium]|nr:nuclear transport factor 2 family protein [Acidobacteriota bacterium]